MKKYFFLVTCVFSLIGNAQVSGFELATGGGTSDVYHLQGNVGFFQPNPGYKIDISNHASEAYSPTATFDNFFRITQSDATGDFFVINNAATASGQLTPILHANRETGNSTALVIMGSVTTGNDLGSAPVVEFNSRVQAGFPTAITVRPLFQWKSHDQVKMTMLANGSLGLGTLTTGTHKLAVEGSIGARQIVVEAGAWSDFVFEKGYYLPTLFEVENYINRNGHLQDIPSAAEVEDSGINLGEMDAKLLQKIEELTLYTIQQQKEIEALKTLTTELIQKLEEENHVEPTKE